VGLTSIDKSGGGPGEGGAMPFGYRQDPARRTLRVRRAELSSSRTVGPVADGGVPERLETPAVVPSAAGAIFTTTRWPNRERRHMESNGISSFARGERRWEKGRGDDPYCGYDIDTLKNIEKDRTGRYTDRERERAHRKMKEKDKKGGQSGQKCP